MKINTEDYLKKSLLDTQERVRDFMHFSQDIKDSEISDFFREYALSEGEHANKLQAFLDR